MPKSSNTAVLTVTSKGQVTLRKDVLRHIGAKPGDKISVNLAPNGQAVLSSKPSDGSLDAFMGSLYDPNGSTLTIDEINDAIADAWAGKR